MRKDTDAESLYCPFALNSPAGKGDGILYCESKNCMAWKYDPERYETAGVIDNENGDLVNEGEGRCQLIEKE